MIFLLTGLFKLLPLAGLILGSPTTDDVDRILKTSLDLPTTIKDPSALEGLEANITAYTVPRNYGSASFNVVRALYPGAVGLWVILI